MDTTQLVSLSQQLAAFQSMDSIANNLANISTPGFKREMPEFRTFVERFPATEGQTGSQTLSFVLESGSLRNQTQGHLETTGAPFDLGLNGKGYFVVRTANGTAYTRNGHFSLDGSGRLVTDSGDPVEGIGGPITVSATDGNIHVAADGTVSGTNGQIGQLNIVDFADDRQLVKQGDSLYSTPQTARPATDTTIRQGAIESSNVQPVTEITNMIEVMRTYQANVNLSQAHSDLVRRAIDKLSSVQA